MTPQPSKSSLDWDVYQRDCPHAHREMRYSIVSNGVKQYREQCLDCGELSNFLKKSDPRVMLAPEIQPVDEALRQQKRREAFQRHLQEQEARQAQHQDDWWQRYNAYLDSPAWQQKRQLVLKRDAYLCQACRMNKATQVHHLTYNHLGDEPLFELVSICRPCHDRLTMMDRRRRHA
ncbi:MAG: hypothetical protein M3380_09490 [Chloroflexota bacterium]|nr:hypothetical protein [Chloroflexota bacterium]